MTTSRWRVKKILRGYRREETSRIIAFRSHWGFTSEYCNPATPGNENPICQTGFALSVRQLKGMRQVHAVKRNDLRESPVSEAILLLTIIAVVVRIDPIKPFGGIEYDAQNMFLPEE
jgi:hypothetical protein